MGELSFAGQTNTGIYWHDLWIGLVWRGHGFEFHLGELAVWLVFLALIISLMGGMRYPTVRQSPSPADYGAESVHSGKQNTADKSELLPTQLPKGDL